MICWNKRKKMARTNKAYPDEILFERAAKFTHIGDLKKFDNKAYQALWRRNLLDEIAKKMEPRVTEAYSMEEFAEEAIKHKTKTDFRNANRVMYDAAYKRELLPIICSHMPEFSSIGENHPGFKWSFDVLHEKAKKYNSKTDFRNGDPQAYDAAYVKGCLDQICSHMEEIYHNWTDSEIVRVFNLCSSRGEVQKKFSRAYQVAREKGEEFLDKVSSGFKKTGGTSIAEKEILAIVKSYIPEAKKLHKLKIHVPGKPFIKSFELDVYVESLGKAIEYDGTRYHSFKFMRKDTHKKFWSDDDIRNYHEIKDAAFLTKGITILHIKEEDWEDNKEACIEKIMNFLEIRD